MASAMFIEAPTHSIRPAGFQSTTPSRIDPMSGGAHHIIRQLTSRETLEGDFLTSEGSRLSCSKLLHPRGFQLRQQSCVACARGPLTRLDFQQLVYLFRTACVVSGAPQA